MKLRPRYDGPPVIAIEGDPADILAPAIRQRRRLEALLATLDAEQWASPTRCEGWDVRDIVAHLVSVNSFWTLSISQGLEGKPTRYLESFDPVETPAAMVAGARGTEPSELLRQLVATDDELFGVVGGMVESGWSMPAEGPVGHLPIHLILRHGLWDAWVHERDIVLPLGLTPVVEPDEVEASVVFASALSPAMRLIQGVPFRGEFMLSTSDPSSRWMIEVADRVSVRIGGEGADAPCLAGRAVDLAEALSLRAPLPSGAPDRWRDLLGGLVTAFDADDGAGRISG